MLAICLKEWSVVCRHLEEGRQTILLRKGGIHEDGGAGIFRLEQERFLLFPAWVHQNPDWVKADYRDQARPLPEPEKITLSLWAHVQKIWQVPSRTHLNHLDDLHMWNETYLDHRWNYRPQNPLYLILLQAHQLQKPVVIENRWEYGGCRSWVPLHPADQIAAEPSRQIVSSGLLSELKDRLDKLMA